MANIGSLTAVIGVDTIGLKRGLAQSARSFNNFADTTKRSLTSILAVFGVVAGATGVGLLAKSINKAAVELDVLNRSLTAVFGTQAQATDELGFVAEAANKLGLNLKALRTSYLQLTAATKGTIVEGNATKQVFAAVAEAAAVLGLTADQTHGALYALSQMASKGAVQMEELRRQLGERLYGAFQIAARGLGKTTQELNKMMLTGGLFVDEFFPAFAKEVHKTFGEGVANAVLSARAAFNRFNNALLVVRENLGTALLPVITSVAKSLTRMLEGWGNTLKANMPHYIEMTTAAFAKFKAIISNIAAIVVPIFSTTLKTIKSIGAAISENVSPAIPAIVNFADALLSGMINVIRSAKDAIVQDIDFIQRTFNIDLTKIFNTLTKITVDVFRYIKNTIEYLNDFVPGVILAVKPLIDFMAEEFYRLPHQIALIGESFEKIKPQLTAFLNEAIRIFKKITEGYIDFLKWPNRMYRAIMYVRAGLLDIGDLAEMAFSPDKLDAFFEMVETTPEIAKYQKTIADLKNEIFEYSYEIEKASKKQERLDTLFEMGLRSEEAYKAQSAELSLQIADLAGKIYDAQTEIGGYEKKIEAVVPPTEEFSNGVEETADVSGVFADIMQKMKGIMEGYKSSIIDGDNAVKQFLDDIMALTVGAEGASRVFMDFGESLEAFEKESDALGKSVKSLGAAAIIFNTDLDMQTVKLLTNSKSLQKISEYMVSTYDKWGVSTSKLGKQMQKLDAFFNSSTNSTTILKKTIIKAFTEAGWAIQDAIAFTEELEKAINKFGDESWLHFLENLHDTTADFFKDIMSGETNSIGDLFKKTFDFVKDIWAETLADMLRNYVENFAQKLRDETKTIWESITDFMKSHSTISVLGAMVGVGGLLYSQLSKTRESYSVTGSSLLGDRELSRSIVDSLNLLTNINEDSLFELRGIYKAIADLNANLTGVSGYIVRGFGDWSVKLGDFTSDFRNFADSMTFGAWTAVFGGQKTKTLLEAGIQTGGVTIQDILNGLGLKTSEYAYSQLTTSGGWFHSDKTDYITELFDTTAKIENAFGEIFENMSQTMVEVAKALGKDNMTEVLGYMFDVSKIDLKDLSQEEILDKITTWASEQADIAVEALFGSWVSQYQKVSETLLTTAIRLASDVTEVNRILEMTGATTWGRDNAQHMIAFSESLVEIAGGLDNLSSAADHFYDVFIADSQSFIDQQVAFSTALREAGVWIFPETREAFADLLVGMQLSTDATKEHFVALLNMTDMADKYYKMLEKRADIYKDVNAYFADILNSQGDLARQISNVQETVDDYIQSLVELGEAESDLAWMRENEQLAIEKIIRDYASALTTAEEEISSGFADFKRGLLVGDVAPVQSYGYFISEFEKLLATTDTKDELSTLYSFFQNDYLPFMQAWSGMNERYADVFDEGLARIENVANSITSTDNNQDLADKIRDALVGATLNVSVVEGEQVIQIVLDGRVIAEVNAYQSTVNPDLG